MLYEVITQQFFQHVTGYGLVLVNPYGAAVFHKMCHRFLAESNLAGNRFAGFGQNVHERYRRITSYNVCYTKLLRGTVTGTRMKVFIK